MHDGCSASFEDGRQVADKVRMMGFSGQPVPVPLPITCTCGESFSMQTFESQCPACGNVYAVTPCHAFDPDNAMAAGIGY